MIEPFLLAEAGDNAKANRASEAWIIAFAFPRDSSPSEQTVPVGCSRPFVANQFP